MALFSYHIQCNKFETYLDSKLVGSIITDKPTHIGNGDLSIGSSPDGSNIFNGWIDDVRLYNVVLSSKNIQVGYGDGYGDFGPIVEVEIPMATNVSPIPVVLHFKDELGQLVEVQDFEDNETNESAVLIEGGILQNLRADNNSTYRFEIYPDNTPKKSPLLSVQVQQQPFPTEIILKKNHLL